ncbi:glycosyltransferase family 39 protein [Belnapia sp. T18]|uniref:Glycosyltransferase family 39 protein n=1 Tax=Belnapia arida TaxID=2804533 RepID=A0ABS1UAS9_9PROT|nr:glycosyltransferase family 39 protein [Belnapia arida]MBL6081786.1 glycosyltransferase family 39 protein [Belnapia arida]
MAEEVKNTFVSHSSLGTVVNNLRNTDVHPPLYFMFLSIWRELLGDNIVILRSFSVICSALAVITWIFTIWRMGFSPIALGLAVTLAYGFGYSGHIARGFALAHLFVAFTVLAAVEAYRVRTRSWKFLSAWVAVAGLCGGFATLTNYLAVFPVAAVLIWLIFNTPRKIISAACAGLPFALATAANLYFFIAQKSARVGQFEPFELFSIVIKLIQLNAASLFGGLPLYVSSGARAPVEVALGALLLMSTAMVVVAWRKLGPMRWLWLSGLLAPSLGLMGLGVIFGNSPAELRYVAFSVPFAAGLFVSTASVLYRNLPQVTSAWFTLVLVVEAAGALGMMVHPKTQQPFRAALDAASPYFGSDTVLLVPAGNDGVGIMGSILQEVPRQQPILMMGHLNASTTPHRAAGFDKALLIGIGDRDGIKQIQDASNALREYPFWRSTGVIWRDFRGHYVEVFERTQNTQGANCISVAAACKSVASTN